MFFPIPIKLNDGRDFHAIPVANGILVAMNVLFFCLGWHPWVGPGTSFFSLISYSFGHADVWHLSANMIALLVFGTPVNRRIGNAWYMVLYLGTAMTIGIIVRLFVSGYMLGASGAIFAVIAVATILIPSARIEIAYFALLPATFVIGLFQSPPHWVFWLIRWDKFSMKAQWGLFIVPLLELWGLFDSGLNWTNLGHLFGLICGVIAVLLMPARITMNPRWSPGTAPI